MRHHPKKLQKLQKISETSSPSKQQQSPIQTASLKSRINPANLTSSYLKFKRFEQQKDKKVFQIQESIKAQCESNHNNEKQEFDQVKQKQSIEQKNVKISQLQQKIVKKKIQLTMLEQCFQKRNQNYKKSSFQIIFNKILQKTLKLCSYSREGRKSYLNLVLLYQKQRKTKPQSAFRILFQWTLKIVKQTFRIVSKCLKLPTQTL